MTGWAVVVTKTPTTRNPVPGAAVATVTTPGFPTRDAALAFMATVVPTVGWAVTGTVRKDS